MLFARDFQPIAKELRPIFAAKEPQFKHAIIQNAMLVEAQLAAQPHTTVADIDEQVVIFQGLVVYGDCGVKTVKLGEHGDGARKISRRTQIFEPARTWLDRVN